MLSLIMLVLKYFINNIRYIVTVCLQINVTIIHIIFLMDDKGVIVCPTESYHYFYENIIFILYNKFIILTFLNVNKKNIQSYKRFR